MIFVVIRDRGIGQTLCSFEHVSCSLKINQDLTPSFGAIILDRFRVLDLTGSFLSVFKRTLNHYNRIVSYYSINL